MINFKACKESLNPFILIDYIIDKRRFNKEHPDYFLPDGLVVFTGPQGSGKTLSAVNYVEKLINMYPKAKIVSNLFAQTGQSKFSICRTLFCNCSLIISLYKHAKCSMLISNSLRTCSSANEYSTVCPMRFALTIF